MRALTIRQPWASLIAVGEKGIETRSFPTTYRGTVLIHASKSATREEREIEQLDVFRTALHGDVDPEQDALDAPLPRGVVVAVATLVGCVPMETLRPFVASIASRRAMFSGRVAGSTEEFVSCTVGRNELRFGDFSDGRYGWLFDNVQALSSPVPADGRLQLWTPPSDVALRALAQVDAYEFATILGATR